MYSWKSFASIWLDISFATAKSVIYDIQNACLIYIIYSTTKYLVQYTYIISECLVMSTYIITQT